MVGLMEHASFDQSLLKPRHVVSDEESFWKQLVEELLDCKLDPIENVANLKVDLERLRNTAVPLLCFFSSDSPRTDDVAHRHQCPVDGADACHGVRSRLLAQRAGHQSAGPELSGALWLSDVAAVSGHALAPHRRLGRGACKRGDAGRLLRGPLSPSRRDSGAGKLI